MKNRLWLYQLPLISFFAFCFYIFQQGERGALHSEFLRNEVFPQLRTLEGALTNLKFKVRGAQKEKNKIVIVAIDEYSIENVGRWPWRRDYIAQLIQQIFAAGAKVVGLDIVFSEPDYAVPPELADVLRKKGMGDFVEQFDTDAQLVLTVDHFKEQLVMGWALEGACQPSYHDIKSETCPIQDPEYLKEIPEDFVKFSVQNLNLPEKFDVSKTAISTVFKFLPNHAPFRAAAKNAGGFYANLDPDGFIRRSRLFQMSNGNAYPSLALEMARVGLGEELEIDVNNRMEVASLKFKKSGREIPVNPQGGMDINFRGPGYTYPYVPALDVMLDEPTVQSVINRKISTVGKSEILKDAYVLIGATALGVYDMRNFPFESNVAGVEGHANILGNLLAGDPLEPVTSGNGFIFVFLLMVLGAIAVAYFTERLESIPALLLFVGTVGTIAFIDFKFLFENNINWSTSFFYVEVFSVFGLTVAAKYVIEEKDKKFLRGAFGKYVAPALVDSIVKDPDSLSLGGEKKELTILFSDIRGFTTLSEKMDAKHLARFLNDYLGEMTQIIFETNGTVDKFIGDAIMAFWGAPLDQKDHAARCCRSAIKMHQALDLERPKLLKEYGVDVQIGIGVNTGLVNVGNMGSETNFNYTVIGDHVNLASRLEGLTKYYSAPILATRFTLEQIEKSGVEIPPHRTLDSVKVKGKKQAVELVEFLHNERPNLGLGKFEEARQLYLHQKWDEAIAVFGEAERIFQPGLHNRDGTCKMYLDRCEYFKTNPPGENWDGSWEMTSK